MQMKGNLRNYFIKQSILKFGKNNNQDTRLLPITLHWAEDTTQGSIHPLETITKLTSKNLDLSQS